MRQWITRRVALPAALGMMSSLGVAGVPPAPAADARDRAPADATRLADPGAVLPRGWRESADRAVTSVGDEHGLRLLVADQASGYRWRTAANLIEPGYDSGRWIGQACVTGSGRRAAVVYAPRESTNSEPGRAAGGFVAVVDLVTGAVRKLAVRSSLAYFNPGCGTAEDFTVSALGEDSRSHTEITTINAADGAVRRTVAVTGQVTSPVPYAGKVAAAAGDHLIEIDATGAVRTLQETGGMPFRLHPERSGGLAYEVAMPDRKVEIRRWSGRLATVLGTSTLDGVRLHATAGRVFVTGPDRAGIRQNGVTRLAAPIDAEPSTSGALALTRAVNRGPVTPAGAGGTTGTVDIRATLTATGKAVAFAVPAGPTGGSTASPALTGPQPRASASKSVTAAADPGTVAWDPDRSCAIPRNDPAIQAFQATAKQVEWAVDQAVQGRLMITRPANWKTSGMPQSWQPQALFPPHSLIGGGRVPAQVLLGVLAQESNTMHASPHVVDGQNGNFNQGGFYGWGDHSSWSSPDCGYGVGQVTTGMAVADGSSVFTPVQQKAIATDYASNIAASMNMLIDKWNQLKTAGITANNGDPQYIENWYLAAWAYNTGVQPNAANGNTTGCTPSSSCADGNGYWGLGWANNPANPSYPADRPSFDGDNDYDTKHPNEWPYQEKVIAWAYTPVGRFNYDPAVNNWDPSYARAQGAQQLPASYSAFCDPVINHCSPGTAVDKNGKVGAGQCLLSNLHCWWHQSSIWVTCGPRESGPSSCGTEVLSYASGAAEPGAPIINEPDCNLNSLPTNAAIVDEVTVPSPLPCAKGWTDVGSFSLNFPYTTKGGCTSNCIHYQGKIDFHQAGAGLNGHIWFTHTGPATTVTGTWKPPASRVGWTRIMAHLPKSGATTEQADYFINLGNGQTRHRMVNQYWWKNTWVDLGTFNLAAGASVSLSNASSHVAASKIDGGDIAYDAMAFVPSNPPMARYVALGDSYSSGEGNPDFEADSTSSRDGCHRSLTKSYASLVKLPNHGFSIAEEAGRNVADFHLLACSGAQSVDLTQAAVTPGNTDNTLWRRANNYHYGEVNQIDESGWLDEDTTLVTVSIGGNDVGFADLVQSCLMSNNCLASDYRLTRTFGDANPNPKVVDPQPLITYEPYLIAQLKSHLVSVYEQIHLKAPNARIVVVGYPRLFRNNSLLACQNIDSATQAWMNQMADRVTQTIAAAVQTTRTDYPATRISFADPTAAYNDHAVCEIGKVQWLNGIVPSNREYSFHPNNNGHIGYADVVNASLVNE